MPPCLWFYKKVDKLAHDANQPKVKKEPKFIKPTFEKFLSQEEISNLLNTAGTCTNWDFNSALGDTIMERYESLYCKMIELNNTLITKGAAGYFWIVTSPEIASIFETATSGFHPISSEEFEGSNEIIGGVRAQGVSKFQFCGTVNGRWRLNKSSDIPSNMLLMGCNDTLESPSHYGRMMVLNFIL
jgi:hypothetical protein